LKIISLVGSPHGLRGNTACLLSHILEGAKKEGATNETIVLVGNNVLPSL
jgi:multimeric flavodoxin WrbA